MPTVIVMDPKGVAAIENRISNVGDAVLDAVYRDVRNSAPIKVRNSPGPAGALKASIRKTSTGGIGGIRRVYAGTDHWHFVEYGTRPHIIDPRRKQALWWPGAGFPRKRVHHPGATANPFMRSSLYKTRFVRIIAGRVEVF